jgi:ribosomal protein S27E
MQKSFGVKCKGCGKHISLANVEPENDKEVTFYALPLGPITCPNCKHEDQYNNDDKEYVS